MATCERENKGLQHGLVYCEASHFRSEVYLIKFYGVYLVLLVPKNESRI